LTLPFSTGGVAGASVLRAAQSEVMADIGVSPVASIDNRISQSGESVFKLPLNTPEKLQKDM
jgi:hypothetical protein